MRPRAIDPCNRPRPRDICHRITDSVVKPRRIARPKLDVTLCSSRTTCTVRRLDEPTVVVDQEEHCLRTDQGGDLRLDAPSIVDLLLKRDHPVGAERFRHRIGVRRVRSEGNEVWIDHGGARRLTQIVPLVADLATTDDRHSEAPEHHHRREPDDDHQAHSLLALFLVGAPSVSHWTRLYGGPHTWSRIFTARRRHTPPHRDRPSGSSRDYGIADSWH